MGECRGPTSGVCLLQNLFHAQKALGGDGVKSLAGLHDVKVEFGNDAKDVKYPVQHFPVLSGDAADALKLAPPGQFLHQRGHLDGLGPGPENSHHLQLSSSSWANKAGARGGLRRPVFRILLWRKIRAATQLRRGDPKTIRLDAPWGSTTRRDPDGRCETRHSLLLRSHFDQR